MKTENVVFLLFLLQILFREVASTESPVLMKILQSVDGATSDKHLFEVTLRLLKSLCICMRDTLKVKEDKLVTDGFNFVSKPKNEEKVVDLYRKIYNKTCLSLRKELSDKLNKSKETENESIQNSSKNNINKHASVQNLTSDNVKSENPEIESILSKILIQNKDTYKYTIKQSNLFRKLFVSETNSMRKKQIIIISLNFSKNETKNGKIPIDIEFFSAQYLNNLETTPIKNVLPCSVNSIYKYLLEKKRNDKIKVFKILKREENIKLYIDIINEESYYDIINECCDGNDKTKPECQYNTNQHSNLLENGKANFKETIFKIVNLLKLYDETTKYDKNNYINGNRDTNNTDFCLSSDDNVLNITSSRTILKNTKILLNEYATESSKKIEKEMPSILKKLYKDNTKMIYNGLDDVVKKKSRDKKENNVLKSLLNTEKIFFMQNNDIETTEFGDKAINSDIEMNDFDREKIDSKQNKFTEHFKNTEGLNIKNNFNKSFVKYPLNFFKYDESYSSDTTTATTFILNNYVSHQTKELDKNIKSDTISNMDSITKNSFLQSMSSSTTNNYLTLKHKNSNSKYITQNVAVSNMGHKENQTKLNIRPTTNTIQPARKMFRSSTDPLQYRTNLVKSLDTTTIRPFKFKNTSPRSELIINTTTPFSQEVLQNSTELFTKFSKKSKTRIVGAQSVLHKQLRNNSYSANDDLLDVIVRQRGRLVRTLAESIEIKDNDVHQSFTVTESLGPNAIKTINSKNKLEDGYSDHVIVKDNENTIDQKDEKSDIIQEQTYDNSLQEKSSNFEILERPITVDKTTFFNVSQSLVQHFPTKYNFDMDLNYNESVGIEIDKHFTVSMPELNSESIQKVTLKTDFSTQSYEIKKDKSQSPQKITKMPFMTKTLKEQDKTDKMKLQSNKTKNMENATITLLTTSKYNIKQMIPMGTSTYESIIGDLQLTTARRKFHRKLVTDKFTKNHKKPRILKGNQKIMSFHKSVMAKNNIKTTFKGPSYKNNGILVEKTTHTTDSITTKVKVSGSKNIAMETNDFVTVNPITNSTVKSSIQTRIDKTPIVINDFVIGTTKTIQSMDISTNGSTLEGTQSSTAKYEFEHNPVNDKSGKSLIKSINLIKPIISTDDNIGVTIKNNTKNILQNTSFSLSEADIPGERTTDTTESVTTKVSSTLESNDLAIETIDFVTVNSIQNSTVVSLIKNRIDKTPIIINDFVIGSTKMIKPMDLYTDGSTFDRTQSSTAKYEFKHKPVNDKSDKILVKSRNLIKHIIPTEDNVEVTTKYNTENILQNSTYSLSEANRLNSITLERTTNTTDSIIMERSSTLKSKDIASETTEFFTVNSIQNSTMVSPIKNRIDKTSIIINDFVIGSTKRIQPRDISTDESTIENIQSSTPKYKFKNKLVNDKSAKSLVKSRNYIKPIIPTEDKTKVTIEDNTENILQSTTYNFSEAIKINSMTVESTTDTTDKIATKASSTLESNDIAVETIDFVTVNSIPNSTVVSSIKSRIDKTPIIINEFGLGSTKIIQPMVISTDGSTVVRPQSSTAKYEFKRKPVNDKSGNMLVKSRNLINTIIPIEDNIEVTTKDNIESILQNTTYTLSKAKKLNSMTVESTTDKTDNITTKASTTLESNDIAIKTIDFVTVNYSIPNSTVVSSIKSRIDKTPIIINEFGLSSTKNIQPMVIFTDESTVERTQSSTAKYEFKHKPVNDKSDKTLVISRNLINSIIPIENNIEVTTKDNTQNILQNTTYTLSEVNKFNSMTVWSATDTTDSITMKGSSTLKSENIATETTEFVTINSIPNLTAVSSIKNILDKTPIIINEFGIGSTKIIKPMDISTDESTLENTQSSTTKYEFKHKLVNDKSGKSLVKSTNLIKPAIPIQNNLEVKTKDNTKSILQSTTYTLSEAKQIDNISVESTTDTTDSIITITSSTLENKDIATKLIDFVTVNQIQNSTVVSSNKRRTDKTPNIINDFLIGFTKIIQPMDISTDGSTLEKTQSSTAKYEFKHKPVNDKSGKLLVKSRNYIKPIMPTEDDIEVATKDNTNNILPSTIHMLSEAKKLNSMTVESTTDTTDSIITKVSTTLESKDIATETTEFVTVNSIQNSTVVSSIKNRTDKTPIIINSFVIGSTKMIQPTGISTVGSTLEKTQSSTAKYEFKQKLLNDESAKSLVKSRNYKKLIIQTDNNIEVTTKANTENILQSTTYSLSKAKKYNSLTVESTINTTDSISTKLSSTLENKDIATETIYFVTVNPIRKSTVVSSNKNRTDKTPIIINDFDIGSTNMIKPMDKSTDGSIKRSQSSTAKYEFKHKPVNVKSGKLLIKSRHFIKPIIPTEDNTKNILQSTTSKTTKLNSIPVEGVTRIIGSLSTKNNIKPITMTNFETILQNTLPRSPEATYSASVENGTRITDRTTTSLNILDDLTENSKDKTSMKTLTSSSIAQSTSRAGLTSFTNNESIHLLEPEHGTKAITHENVYKKEHSDILTVDELVSIGLEDIETFTLATKVVSKKLITKQPMELSSSFLFRTKPEQLELVLKYDSNGAENKIRTSTLRPIKMKNLTKMSTTDTSGIQNIKNAFVSNTNNRQTVFTDAMKNNFAGENNLFDKTTTVAISPSSFVTDLTTKNLVNISEIQFGIMNNLQTTNDNVTLKYSLSDSINSKQRQNTTIEVLNVTTMIEDITKSQILNFTTNGKITTTAHFSTLNPKVTNMDEKPIVDTISFESRNSSSSLATENTSMNSIDESVTEVIKPTNILTYSKDDSTHKHQDSTTTTTFLKYVKNNTRSNKITQGVKFNNTKNENNKPITSSTKKINKSLNETKNVVYELSKISNTTNKFISTKNATNISFDNTSLGKQYESFGSGTKKTDYSTQQYQASTTKATSIDVTKPLDQTTDSDKAIIKKDKVNSEPTTLSTNSTSTINTEMNMKTNSTVKQVIGIESYLALINLTSGATINVLNDTLESTYIPKISTKLYDPSTSGINSKVTYDFERMTSKYSESNQAVDINYTSDTDIVNIGNTIELASVTFKNENARTNTTFNKEMIFENHSRNTDIKSIDENYKHDTYLNTENNHDYNENSTPLNLLRTTNMYESSVNVMFSTNKNGDEKVVKINTTKLKKFINNMTTKIDNSIKSETRQVLYYPSSINTSRGYSDGSRSTPKTMKFIELYPTVMKLSESDHDETTKLVAYSKDKLSDRNNQSSIYNFTKVDTESALEFRDIENGKRQPSKVKTYQSETWQDFWKNVSEKLTNAFSSKTVSKQSYKEINLQRYNVSEININLKGYNPRSDSISTDQINISVTTPISTDIGNYKIVHLKSNKTASKIIGVKKTQLFSEVTIKPWQNIMNKDHNLINSKKNRTTILKYEYNKMKEKTPTTTKVHKIIYNTFKPASEEDYKTTSLEKEITTSQTKPVHFYVKKVIELPIISTTTLKITTPSPPTTTPSTTTIPPTTTTTSPTTTIKTPSTKILIKPTRIVYNPVTARYIQKYNSNMKTNNYIRSRIVTKNFRVFKKSDVNLASPFEKQTVFPVQRKVLKSMKYRQDETRGRNVFGVQYGKPSQKSFILRPKFNDIKPIKSNGEYFKSPVVPNDEDYYRRDFSIHHRPTGITFKDKISYLHEALNNQFKDEDRIVEPDSVVEKPSYLLPKTEPRLLRDRIDSIRNYISNAKITTSSSNRWNNFFIEDDDMNESYTRSLLYFSRTNYQQISSSSTTTPKGRRKGITLFFYSPTVPYNRYF